MAEQQPTGTDGQQGGQAANTGTDAADAAADAATKGAENAGGAEGSKDPARDSAALEAANAAQKQVNRDLETKLNQLRDGLKSALGIEDKKDGNTETLISALQEQLNTLSHTNLVSEVALSHGITDAADRALLSGIKDKDAMEKLAARLAPQGGDDATGKNTSGKPGTPKADPSQGRGTGKAGVRATSVAQVIADRQAAREKK